MSKTDDIRDIIRDNFGSPKEPDRDIEKAVSDRFDNIAKPIDGLGEFEKIIEKIGAITATEDIDISKRAVVIMIADNGIVEEGVTQSDSSVTRDVAKLMRDERSSVGVISKVADCDTFPINIGIKGKPIDGLIDMKIADGTNNFSKLPAMKIDDTFRAIMTGIDMVRCLKNDGYKIIATGEMGIGNTTSSSAIIASLLFRMPEEIVGRGAGLSNEKLLHKINVVKNSLRFHELDTGIADPIDALSSVGGLDIAGLAGVFIGGSIFRIPIIVDGLISGAAALVAERIVPGVRDYMIASHIGKEPGMKFIFDELDLHPVINAGMKLGEGTGAVMLLPLLDTALALYKNGTLFNDIKLKKYERFEGL